MTRAEAGMNDEIQVQVRLEAVGEEYDVAMMLFLSEATSAETREFGEQIYGLIRQALAPIFDIADEQEEGEA